jgi:uncharacterized phage-associated protein
MNLKMTEPGRITNLGINPIDVARYFVCKANENRRAITPLKLQKLVYYAYARCLANEQIKLFNERIEAWQNGPVIPSIYHALKEFGANSIPAEWAKCDNLRETEQYRMPVNVSAILKEVNDQYGHFSAFDLVTLTHTEQPWINARADLPSNANSTRYIKDEDILGQYNY